LSTNLIDYYDRYKIKYYLCRWIVCKCFYDRYWSIVRPYCKGAESKSVWV